MTNDEILDRMDLGIPPASPEEVAARRPYEELFAMIREYRDPPSPISWDATWARWQRHERMLALLGQRPLLRLEQP